MSHRPETRTDGMYTYHFFNCHRYDCGWEDAFKERRSCLELEYCDGYRFCFSQNIIATDIKFVLVNVSLSIFVRTRSNWVMFYLVTDQIVTTQNVVGKGQRMNEFSEDCFASKKKHSVKNCLSWGNLSRIGKHTSFCFDRTRRQCNDINVTLKPKFLSNNCFDSPPEQV